MLSIPTTVFGQCSTMTCLTGVLFTVNTECGWTEFLGLPEDWSLFRLFQKSVILLLPMASIVLHFVRDLWDFRSHSCQTELQELPKISLIHSSHLNQGSSIQNKNRNSKFIAIVWSRRQGLKLHLKRWRIKRKAIRFKVRCLWRVIYWYWLALVHYSTKITGNSKSM